MLTLSLDLAGEIGSAAISSDGGQLATAELQLQNAPLCHCARLISEAARLAEVRIDDLELLSVITGPGSWTGLRVAAVTLNTMSAALRIPVVGVNLFEVLQRFLDPAESKVLGVVQINPRKACVATLEPGPQRAFEISVLGITDLVDLLNGQKAILALNRLTLAELRDQCSETTLVDTYRLPRASLVAADIAIEKWRANPSSWAAPIRPLYIGSPVTTAESKLPSYADSRG
jgi:tRNA threonylcarbamoyl adenosine modification protein YeaZ